MNLSTFCNSNPGRKFFVNFSNACFSMVIAFALMLVSSASSGQSLVETFNYTVAGNIGGSTGGSGTTNNNWTTHNNSQPGTVSTVTGSLNYTGLSTANNRVSIPGSNSTTPRDINRACGLPGSQNTTYYSFLLKVVDEHNWLLHLEQEVMVILCISAQQTVPVHQTLREKCISGLPMQQPISG